MLETLLGAGTWTYSIQTRDIFWSAGLYALLGLDPHTVMASRDIYDALIHPEDRLSHDEIVEKAEAGELAVRRFRVIRPDGRLLWLESKSRREYDRLGRLVFLHGVVQDISDREKVDSECVRLKAAVGSMKKIAGGDFWRTDPDGRLIDTASWSRFTGETGDRLKDHEALPAIHPEDREIVKRAREEGLRLHKAVEFTVRVRRAGGDYATVEHKVIPVFGSDGSLVEWHGMSWTKQIASPDLSNLSKLRGCHVRAARAMLGMTARELAHVSKVSFSTVRRIEDDIDSLQLTYLNKVEKALVDRGVIFSIASDQSISIGLRST